MIKKITLTNIFLLFSSNRPVTHGCYYLCAIEKNIALRRREDVPDHPDIIAVLNSKQINGEMSSWKWREIEKRILYLEKKGLL